MAIKSNDGKKKDETNNYVRCWISDISHISHSQIPTSKAVSEVASIGSAALIK